MINIKFYQTIALGCVFTSALTFADGKSDYDTKCTACHGFGVAGAPTLDNKDSWTLRLEKGIEAMYENAIKGFQGETGYMPAKGGFADLSDEQIRAVVDYMVQQTGIN